MALTKLITLKQVARKRAENSIIDSAGKMAAIMEAMDIWAFEFGEFLLTASFSNPNIPLEVKYKMFCDQREVRSQEIHQQRKEE